MKRFFPGYISYIIQLLDKYYEFTVSRDPEDISVIPIILGRIENLRHRFEKLQSREDLTKADQFKRNIRSFQTLLMELVELTDKMVKHVSQVCEDIGLVPCTNNLKKNNTMISKLNRAWSLFRSDPKKLHELEKKLI